MTKTDSEENIKFLQEYIYQLKTALKELDPENPALDPLNIKIESESEEKELVHLYTYEQIGVVGIGDYSLTLCGTNSKVRCIDDALDTELCPICFQGYTIRKIFDTVFYNAEVHGSEFFSKESEED